MARPEECLNYTNVVTLPNNLTQRFEYNGDTTVLYAGHAPKGSDESDTKKWTIQKFEYTSMQVVSIKIAFGSWALRSGYTYE